MSVDSWLLGSGAASHPGPLVCGWNVPPQIVEGSKLAGSAPPVASKEPEATVFAGPGSPIVAAPRKAARGQRAQRSVYPCNRAVDVQNAAAPHPSPFPGGRTELPQVVQISVCVRSVEACSAEKPKISIRVRPAERLRASSWGIGGCGCTLLAVYSRLATIEGGYRIASRNPRPFLGRRVEFPEIVEKAEGLGGIKPGTSEKPEITILIRPTDRAQSSAGDVGSGRLTLSAVHPWLAIFAAVVLGKDAAAAHPGPLAGLRMSSQGRGEKNG